MFVAVLSCYPQFSKHGTDVITLFNDSLLVHFRTLDQLISRLKGLKKPKVRFGESLIRICHLKKGCPQCKNMVLEFRYGMCGLGQVGMKTKWSWLTCSLVGNIKILSSWKWTTQQMCFYLPSTSWSFFYDKD